MEANIKHERINSLQALRAIAFLSVFIFHANRSFLGDGVLYDSFIKSLGRWGVSVFFVLSGFVMTYDHAFYGICIYAAETRNASRHSQAVSYHNPVAANMVPCGIYGNQFGRMVSLRLRLFILRFSLSVKADKKTQ